MLYAIRQFAPACILLFAVMFCAVPVDAGFVSSTLDGDAFGGDASLVDFNDGGMRGGEEAPDSQQSPTPEQLRMALLLQQHTPVGVQANPAPTGSTGMGHAPTDAPGSNSPFAILTTEQGQGPALQATLADKSHIAPPVPFLDGIFRPPQG